MIFLTLTWAKRCARLGLVLLAAAAALAGAFPAAGQDALGADELAERRQRCLQAAARLAERPDPGPDIWNAVHAWPRCPDVGPEFIARTWQAPPSEFYDNSVFERRFIEASATVPDERIFTAVLEVLGDRSRPHELRTGALSVAASYADSTHLPIFIGIFRQGATEDERLMVHTPSGSVRWIRDRIQGTQPLLGDPEERLLALLNDIVGRSDEDPNVLAAVRGLLVWHYKIP